MARTIALLTVPFLLAILSAQSALARSEDVRTIFSEKFRTCFGSDAPLSAESYGCLDEEYHRLGALLTAEYRSALARQPNEAGRQRVELSERRWWPGRFQYCKSEVGDLRGATATVANEYCEIDALAQRIVALRRF